MDWLLFALLASACWAVCSIIDKFFMDKRFDSPFSYQIFVSFVILCYLPFIWFLGGLKLDLNTTLPLLAYGFIYAFAAIPYNKVMMMEETSRITSLIYLLPIPVTFLAILFLGEFLTVSKYAGISLLITSALLVSIKKEGSHHIKPKVIGLLAIFILTIAVLTVVAKWYLEFVSPWHILFWSHTGALAASMVMLSKKGLRSDFLKNMKKIGGFESFLIIVATFSFLAADLSLYHALSSGPASLVTAVCSLQPFLVFFYALFLSFFFPKFLYEEHSRFTLVLKSFAVILIVAGTYLVSV